MPFGTGNDLSQVTNWGGSPGAAFYSDFEELVVEICENTKIKDINVWTVRAQLKEDGRIMQVSSRTKREAVVPGVTYESDMINYMGMGEDGRIGFNVEKVRTSNRLCTKALYFFVGAFFLFCPCTRGPTAAEHIDYVKTLESESEDT